MSRMLWFMEAINIIIRLSLRPLQILEIFHGPQSLHYDVVSAHRCEFCFSKPALQGAIVSE